MSLTGPGWNGMDVTAFQNVGADSLRRQAGNAVESPCLAAPVIASAEPGLYTAQRVLPKQHGCSTDTGSGHFALPFAPVC